MAGIRISGTQIKGKAGMFGFGAAAVVMGADANYAAVASDYENPIMVVTSGVALTATRNVTLPLQNGAVVMVTNSTTGAQSLQFIGATGTGVTVANAKTAILRCDGTNWYRVTADV